MFNFQFLDSIWHQNYKKSKNSKFKVYVGTIYRRYIHGKYYNNNLQIIDVPVAHPAAPEFIE